MRPNGLNAEPAILGQPRIADEIRLVAAFYQNRKGLKGEIEAIEGALTYCAQEEKVVLEESLAWLRAKLAETGPSFARAMVKAAPLIRESFESAFAPLLRAASIE